MTDNEIINEFEKEIKYVRENEKYDDFNPIVDIDLCEDILDLINRQKAEIERLKKNIDGLNIFTINHIKVIRLQAMKECLARVKNYIKTHCNPYGKPDFDYDTSIKILNFIDNLVKEMTEVETNQRKEDEGK